MAYLNFTDALMEAKRRAQLQGRPVTQQEAAGLSEGIATSAADRSFKSESLALAKQGQAAQEKQFAEQLATTKEQFAQTQAQRESEFGQTLATTKEQFGAQMGLEQQKFGVQKSAYESSLKQFEESHGLEVSKLNEQIRSATETLNTQKVQFEASSALQKEQFGATMQQRIAESQQALDIANSQLAAQKEQFTSQYDLLKSQYISELIAAGQPIPASMAPEGWNAAQYIKNNPSVGDRSQWASGDPLTHYYMYGKSLGMSYESAPSGFDEARYLSMHPDVAAAVRSGQFSSGLQHYLNYGKAQGYSYA